VADYGTITEKLMIWENKGFDNSVWKDGAAISVGANRDNITEALLNAVPYCIKLNDEITLLFNELTKEGPQEYNKRGGLKLDIEEKSSYELLALLSIPVQFSILEDFEFSCIRQKLENGGIYEIDNQSITLKLIRDKGIEKIVKGRIEHQMNSYKSKSITTRIDKWPDLGLRPLDNKIADIYSNLSERRNVLIHEIIFEPPTLNEAIEYFKKCRLIASKINDSLSCSN
jgi:hypothetical protein